MVLLFCLLAFQALANQTYTELVSLRLRFPKSQPRSVSVAWQATPFSDVVAADQLWVASSTAIFAVDVPSLTGSVVFSQIADPLAVNLGNRTNLFVDSKGLLLGIVTPAKFLVASSGGVQGCPPAKAMACDLRSISFPSSWGTPTCTSTSKSWYIGTSTGLYSFNATTQAFALVIAVPQVPILAVEAWSDGVAVSTNDKLYFFDVRTQTWRFEWVTVDANGGVIDGAASSFAFHQPTQSLFIGTSFSLSRLNLANWSFARIDYLQGLPAVPITAVQVEDNGRVWLATPNAVIIWDSTQALDAWSYLSGPRFLPGTSVRALGAITALTDNKQPGALVGTAAGLAVVVLDSSWTLQQKALGLEAIRERHSRYGLVDSCVLPSFGVLEGCTTKPSDNDGLWTSLIVGAETFRWAATGDSEAQQLAWTHLRAIGFLNQVTGIPGLPARSVYKSATVPPDFPHTWQPSNASCCKGTWIWQGDTSSDEIIGHFFAYSTAYWLLAQNDSERAEVASLLLNIVDYIIDHDFYLLGPDGKPTTWGRWNQKEVNFQRNFSDNRGINSLEIAAFIKSALRICPSADVPKYQAALAALVKEGYNTNLINARVTAPTDDNTSDDELEFLVYALYFMDFGRPFPLPDWDDQVMVSLKRSFEVVKPERSAFWGAVFSAVTGSRDPEILRDISWNLRTFPIEFINWPFANSQRLDVHLRKSLTDKDNVTESVLPYREGGLLVWNGNPFSADGDTSGLNEASPAAYLLPFWMSSYFKLI